MTINKIIPALILAILAALPAPAAAAENYHPGDVAAINRILKINDAGNQLLTRSGWDVGRPETWPVLDPSPAVDRILPQDRSSPLLLNLPESGPGLVWRAGRVVELSLDHGDLTGVLEVGGLTELEVLRVGFNRELSGLNGLGGLNKLTGLAANGDNLDDLGDLSGLTELRWMLLSQNRLTEIRGLGRMKKLRALIAGHNRLTALEPLDELKELGWLELDHNRLTAAPGLGGLTGLRYLNLSANQLAGLEDLGGLTELRELFLYENQLTAVPGLGRLVNLEYLFAAQNQLADLGPLDGLTRLKGLGLNDNRLTTLKGLERADGLTLLNVGNNPLPGRDILAAADTGRLTVFGFSGDQFPEFSLAKGKMDEQPGLNPAASPPGPDGAGPLRGFDELRELAISGEVAPRSVDLDGRRLNSLILHTRLAPEIFINPGGGGLIIVVGDRHYRPSELREMRRRLNLRSFRTYSPQTVTLGDAAAGLKAGRPHTPGELSPLLAADYGGGAERAVIYAFPQAERKIPETLGPKQLPPGAVASSRPGGPITFPAPGRYYLSLKTATAVFHYQDIFTVDAP